MYRLHPLMVCVMLCLVSGWQQMYAQDSIPMSLKDAQDIFMKENLQILSAKFEIEKSEAAIIQASLLNNPELEFVANAYNPEEKKVFDISNRTGDYGIRLEQLFSLGQKRKKSVTLTRTRHEINLHTYEGFVKEMLFLLRSNYRTLQTLQASYQQLIRQKQDVKHLADSYDRLLAKQLVIKSEALRMRAVYYALLGEITTLENAMEDAQNQLRILLNRPDKTIRTEPIHQPVFSGKYSIQNLQDSALIWRPEIQVGKYAVLAGQQAYAFEKSHAVPNLKLGASYARRSEFVPKAAMFNVGIEIPLFNRNQGNIRAAKAETEQAKTEFSILQSEIRSDVQSMFLKVLNTQKALNEMDTTYFSDFEIHLKKVQENMERQNIPILDFTQFHDSYRESVLQFFQLQNEHLQAIEDLNYALGKYIFH